MCAFVCEIVSMNVCESACVRACACVPICECEYVCEWVRLCAWEHVCVLGGMNGLRCVV